MPNRLSLSIFLLLAAIPLLAGERSFRITDYTGWGFAPDLVQYAVPAMKDADYRLTGDDGRALPVQAAPGARTISFVSEIPPNATVSYRLRDDRVGEMPATAVQSVPDGDGLVLSNGLLGVRVPAVTLQAFAPPVPANTLPAPLLAFRNGNGAWLGSGKVLSTRPVKAFRVKLIADGPVYLEACYELEFANGGYYRATIQVIDRVPLAKVTEEYDLRELDGEDYWELNLAKGWSPDTAEAPNTTCGNVREYIGPLRALLQGQPAGKPAKALLPDNGWGPYAIAYLGLWNAAERKANPDTFTQAAFLPLRKGEWRRTTACEVWPADGGVRLQLPLGVRHPGWQTDTASDSSPFSVGEHDPTLPATYGRRLWGLQLASPAPAWQARRPASYAAAPISNRGGTPLTYWQSRCGYGVIGLDQYKDFILRWPDANTAYPRVFIRPDELERYRKAATRSPYANELKEFYLLTGDAKIARRNLGVLEGRYGLGYLANQILGQTTLGHGSQWTWLQILAEDVLAWPELPPADRAQIRAHLALLAYLSMAPDVMSAGNGTHNGNPNMSVSRQQEYANFVALLPDHPLFAKWRDYVAIFTAYKFGSMEAPGGGWFEFGGAYGMHGLHNFCRGLYGQQAAGVPNLDRLFAYTKADWDYYLNLLTPVDSRYRSRMIPGGANSAPAYTEYWLESIGAFAEKDPSFAAKLQWAWENNGANNRPLHPEAVNELLGRPWVKPVEPKLTSRIFPGVGVIFRAHQGPDETYMYLRSGYCWSHWYVDQGHFLLHSKGATLVPFQPYQYYWPGNNAFDLYNTVRFGHPENEFAYAWPDSNILDHAFGPTVDYAWASAGYPEWYIHPGATPGMGDARKLAPGLSQQEGAFTWNRQVMFVKGDTARSPNYFVLRDTMLGDSPTGGKLASWLNLNLLGRMTDVRQLGGHIAVQTEWPTKLDLQFVEPDAPKLEMAEDKLKWDFGGQSGPSWWQLHEKNPAISPNWMLKDGSSVKMPLKLYDNAGIVEKHVFLRLAHAPGQEFFWLLYPRDEKEALPPAEQLAPGVMKVITRESTDYLFLSPTPITFEGEGVHFHGCSGAVRVRPSGVTFAFTGGVGAIGYRHYFLRADQPIERTVKYTELNDFQQWDLYPEYFRPDAPTENGEILTTPRGLRFVMKQHAYARLTAGTVGVRGVGPFDLTFTKDGITGTVAGDTRTLVVTRPAGITRPMFFLDGVQYYAGFADDSAPCAGLATPQFNLAFGVLDGRHTVKITEWVSPPLPPIPARAMLEAANGSSR